MIRIKITSREVPLFLMLVPALLIVIIFSYVPMLGIVIAFQDFKPAMGILNSKFVGLDNFRYIFFELPDTFRILRNTVFIAVMKIIAGLVFPIFISLLLNEVTKRWFKRSIQTLIYLPYFLSWIIMGGIVMNILSLDGAVNRIIELSGLEPVFFMGDAKLFPYMMVFTDIWKTFGFSTIVYLATITNISPTLYEAAVVDGANRWQQTLKVTLPGMAPIIILLALLSIGDIMNAGFEQILTLLSPPVLETGDIIDTFVYRVGLQQAQYSLASAFGLFKSAVSSVLIMASYYSAYKLAKYQIF